MITIKGREYNLKWTLKGLFLYEQASGHPYDSQKAGLQDAYLLAYAMLYASNPGLDMTFDAYIDACDEDPGVFQAWMDLVAKRSEMSGQFAPDKKKVTENL